MYRNTNNLQFRQLTKEDRSDFITLDGLTFPGDELDEENYEKYIQNEGFLGLFSSNNSLVGYLFLRIADSYGHLGRISVHPEHQGNGYGNLLMERAMKYFTENESYKVGVYVESNNVTAINLYQKFGFSKVHESWHYILDLDQHQIDPKPEYILRETKLEDLDFVFSIFPHLNVDTIKDYYNSGTTKVLEDKDQSKILGFIRFNADFSGCMPFEITELEIADQIIAKLKQEHVRRDRDYLRLTFDRYDWLAEIFEKRGYRKHHHLFKLEQSFVIS
jgi:[ribosomal protein S18]-alanine N-acetyltransferase